MSAKSRKAYRAAYNAEHRAERAAYDAAYRAAHLEQHRVILDAWRSAHPENVRGHKAVYRATHREEENARRAVRAAAHPEETRARNRKMGAKRRGAAACEHAACLTIGADLLAWQSSPHVCYLCGTHLESIVWMDHVVAIARGGLHCAENLRPACGPCNMRKGAR